MSRPKFSHIEPERIYCLLKLIGAEAIIVTPTEWLTVSKHEADNRFYE